MGLFSKTRRDLLGIDIGTYAIKLAHVGPSRHGFELCHFASTRTPPGAVMDGVVTDTHAVAAALQDLVAATGTTVRHVATAVGGPRVIARPHLMAPAKDQKLRQAVALEAEKFIAFSIDESIVEPQVVGDRVTDVGRQQEVMIVAAQRPMVETRVEALEMAGLTPELVDAEPFALLRSVVYGSDDPDVVEGSVGIVRLGEDYGDITVVTRGCYVLSRTLPIAGESLTNAIRQALDVDYAEAERLKEEYGIAATDEVLGELGEQEFAVFNAIHPLLEDLAREIRLSLSFYQSQYQDISGGGTVQKLILTGGTSMLRNLDEYLTQSIGQPVERYSYVGHLQLGTSRFEPGYIQAAEPLMGVALGLTFTQHMMSNAYSFSVDTGRFGVAIQQRRQQL